MIEPEMPASRGIEEWKEGWKVVSSAFVGSTLAAMVFFFTRCFHEAVAGRIRLDTQ